MKICNVGLPVALHSLPAGGGLVLCLGRIRLDLTGFLLGAVLRLFHLACNSDRLLVAAALTLAWASFTLSVSWLKSALVVI
jgi:hypothetical protein